MKLHSVMSLSAACIALSAPLQAAISTLSIFHSTSGRLAVFDRGAWCIWRIGAAQDGGCTIMRFFVLSSVIFFGVCEPTFADQRTVRKPWLTDLGYLYGWECQSPYWGWFQYDQNKIAVVSEVERNHPSQNSEALGQCVEGGIFDFYSRRAVGRAQGNTLNYTLYGPNGDVWFERDIELSE